MLDYIRQYCSSWASYFGEETINTSILIITSIVAPIATGLILKAVDYGISKYKEKRKR